ncbi:MAG: T9SS type A sorting domain-containing protein [Saprospiraceae bacterium]|nr:T9SS type A sorting domain-containing protein [Saprospiraceae bacterium]
MKKSTLLLTLIALLIVSGPMIAQPTLQMNVLANIGDVVKLHEADTTNVTQGNAGANQTWNFAGLQALPGVPAVEYYFLAPSNTPYASSFPTANYAVKIDSDTAVYAYAKKDANQYAFLGIKNEYITQQYPNSDIQIKAPLSFNGSFQDDFTNFSDAGTGFIFYATGSRTVKYDAYGTLTTPEGTFQNAMRLKSVSSQVDSANFFGNIIINYTDITTYDWVAANKPGPLVSVYYTHTISKTIIPNFDTIVTDLGITKSVNYIDDLVTGVADRPDELSGITVRLVSQNPAIDVLKISILAEKGDKDLQIQVTDVGGRILETRSVPVNAGENLQSVQVAYLPAGAYFLSISDGRGVKTILWQKQ